MTLLSQLEADFSQLVTDWGQEVFVAGLPMQGLFEADFRRQNLLMGTVESTGPILVMASSDVEGLVEHGTAVTVGVTDYAVAGIQPDGHGITLLILTES